MVHTPSLFLPKLDEEKEKNASKELEFDEEDEFVKMYHMKRLQEMRRRAEEYVSSIRQALFMRNYRHHSDFISNSSVPYIQIFGFGSTSGHNLAHCKIFQARSTLMLLTKKMEMLLLSCICMTQ